MAAFTLYNASLHTVNSLVSALLAPSSGLALQGSASLLYGQGYTPDTLSLVSSLSFYDGSLPSLGIGAGLLLTSGNGAPPLSNGAPSYSVALNPSHTDTALYQAVVAGFPLAGQVKDVTALSFNFTVTNPAYKGVRLDVIFGSEEFPEFTSSGYADIAGVWVNGVNYALFGGNASQPLSVIDESLLAGGVRDNQSGTLPIEYDGVSRKLTIVAPVQQGVNTLKIAIGDTGDEVYDSGLFVANLRGVTYAAGGLATPFDGTSGNNFLEGTAFSDLFTLGAGNDTAKGLGGNGIIDGGAGIDVAQYLGVRANYAISIAADKSTVQALVGSEGTDTLYDMERLAFSDKLIAIDIEGNAGQVYRLYKAAFNRTPDVPGLSYWIHQVDQGSPLLNAATGFIQSQEFKDLYGANPTNAEYLDALYWNVLGREPDQAGYNYWLSVLNQGLNTREEVLVEFSESAENKANVLPLIDEGIHYQLWLP